MIDIFGDELLTLAEAARILPARRAGKKTSISCLYRWTTSGCRGIMLESVQIGGTRCSGREALGRFVANPPRSWGHVGRDFSGQKPILRHWRCRLGCPPSGPYRWPLVNGLSGH